MQDTFIHFISLLFLAVCNGKIRMKAQIYHGIVKGVISFGVLIKHFFHSNVKKCSQQGAVAE